MLYGFSNIATMRTYSVELRERNYPKFEGRYNAYINVYGQLSGEYMGMIEEPLAMDLIPENVSDILNNTDLKKFVHNAQFSKW